ncbi:hypothetical protein K4K51_012805 [Colletotrichum sp. SAR 10_75]|nr:hypothetical protein K4K51_012805 [Colletotrichum sp. SAR 10_75]
MGLPPGVIPAAHGGNAHQAWLKKKSIEYMKERRDRLIDRLGTWNDAHLGHDINPMPGTCTWIETHPFFLEWSKSNATEDFYVYGSAGCGKTYLAKSVANHLSRDASKPWDLVFSFFCNASSTGNKKPPIMEYFIREILRERPQWFELLSSQFLFPDADGKFSMAALFGILRNIMSQLQLGQGPGKSITVYLIVDGLHECDVGFVKEFLALVASLIDHPVARSTPPTPPSAAPPGPFNQLFPRDTVRFKFFTTYTPNEVMAMASVRATRIKMKDQDIRKDIATYVDKRVEDFSTIKSTKDPPAELADSIKEQAESFFVYANCSMEDGFSTARDDDEYGFSMSRRIFPYPQKLGKYFDYNLLPLFQNISNDNYALSALHVILGTIGHIRGSTLRDALACLHDNPRLKFIDIQTILMHQCPRLIRVSDEFEAFPLHPSLRIHFNSYISKDEQHANMASLCLNSGDKDPNGNLDIAELLISYNSSINTINPKSKRHTRSPLMLAVKDQNYPMVELLLKHGADPTLEEAYNLPGVLDAAVYGGNVEILKLLMEHSLPPSVNYVPKDFDHILIEAAEKDVELVKLLLDHGADTKRFLAPGDPRTPLQAAVQEGNLGLCKLFLEYEPELVNHQAKEGLVCETPLNIAAREGHLEIVRCLLEAGSKPNFQSFYYQETPLWSACSRGKFEIAKLLYERAPETINTPSYDGETPLMGACSSGAIKLVAFLLDNGADLTPRCSNCGSCVWKALTNNSDAPAYKMIELLIQHGLGVDDVVSSVGFTVLGEACRSGDLPAVRYLLDLGADPVKGQLCPGKEPSDNSWRSAAQVAVDNREPGILDALLQHPKVADFIANADVYGETAVANADGFIAQYVAQLVKAQHRTIDDHFYIIRMLSRLLLLRTGYDDEAVRLIQAYVVDPWVREKDDRVEEAVFCEYYCDECGKDAEEETLYFCRFCVWTTGRCCFNNYKGMHEPIEVPLVMERRIVDINSEEFMGVLRVLEQDFVTNKAPRVAEPAQKELFEADPESEDTTLSLAFLNSLGYLAFRRRAWNPYLPLAPKIYKRIEPWESFMRQERKEFQEWVYRTETAPWRLKNELEYFLESGRKTAYKDVGTTIAEEIMRDVGILFHEPRRSRSPRMLRSNERAERGPHMLSDEESD